MINEFATLFEARERKQQIERIYRGESVDLVGRVLSDGVPISLENYSVSGIYQPTVSAGDTKFYELSAEVVDNEKVVVHWTYDNDWGEDSYQIWALMKKVDEEAYPLSWRLDLAYSPSWPINPEPGPLPKSLDFAEYTLINAPWLPARQTNIGYDVDTDVQINGDLSANEIRIGAEPLSGAIVEAVDTAVRESIGTVDGKIDSLSGDIAGVAANAQTAATYAQANNNLLTSPNGLSAIHATVKSKASQTSVDAIGTKVDSIKSTVEGITIPTDYAKEATLNAYGQVVTDTNNRVQSIFQYIDGVIYPLETDIKYQVNGLKDGTHPVNIVLSDIRQDGQDTNTTVNAIDNVVTNGTYGNQAIKTKLDTTDTHATSAAQQAKNAYDILNNGTYGNSAIKTKLDTTDTHATSAANQAALANTFAAANNVVLTNNTYGLPAIKDVVDLTHTAAGNAYAAANTAYSYVSDEGYGLPAIKNAIDAISIPNDYAKQTTLVSVSGDLNTVGTNVTSVKATVEDNNDKLGDLATVLDIINGEAV